MAIIPQAVDFLDVASGFEHEIRMLFRKHDDAQYSMLIGDFGYVPNSSDGMKEFWFKPFVNFLAQETNVHIDYIRISTEM